MVYGLLLDRWKDSTTGENIALPNLNPAPNFRDGTLGGMRESEVISSPPLSPFLLCKSQGQHHHVAPVALKRVLSIEQLLLPVVDSNLPRCSEFEVHPPRISISSKYLL